MNKLIYGMLGLVAQVHSYIMSLNDSYEYDFTDKELHFLVIGVVGILMIIVFHALFTLLAKTNHLMVVTWLYVFTVLVMTTFAIEIGQKLTGTGVMDVMDMLSGLWGFIVFFGVFAIIRAICKGIVKLVKYCKGKKSRGDYYYDDEDYD